LKYVGILIRTDQRRHADPVTTDLRDDVAQYAETGNHRQFICRQRHLRQHHRHQQNDLTKTLHE